MISYETEMGKIGISDEILATIAGLAAVECKGVAGMAAHRIQDELAGILRKENLGRGVEVIHKDDQLILRLSLIIQYGSRIREVAREVTDRVAQEVEQWSNIQVDRVEIQVDSVRFPDELMKKKEKRLGGRLMASNRTRLHP